MARPLSSPSSLITTRTTTFPSQPFNRAIGGYTLSCSILEESTFANQP